MGQLKEWIRVGEAGKYDKAARVGITKEENTWDPPSDQRSHFRKLFCRAIVGRKTQSPMKKRPSKLSFANTGRSTAR